MRIDMRKAIHALNRPVTIQGLAIRAWVYGLTLLVLLSLMGREMLRGTV